MSEWTPFHPVSTPPAVSARCRAFRPAILLLTLCLALVASGVAANLPDLVIDARSPGAATGRQSGDKLILANECIAVTWCCAGQRLAPAEIRDSVTGQAITQTGELFSVEVDKTQIPASGFSLTEGPVVGAIAPDPAWRVRPSTWAVGRFRQPSAIPNPGCKCVGGPSCATVPIMCGRSSRSLLHIARS